MSKRNKEGFKQMSRIASARLSNKGLKIIYDKALHLFAKAHNDEKCPNCGKLGGRAYFADGTVRCWECDKITNYKEWFT